MKGIKQKQMGEKGSVDPSKARKKKRKELRNKQGKRNKPNKGKGSRKGSYGGSL